jgi:hypothetical protein
MCVSYSLLVFDPLAVSGIREVASSPSSRSIARFANRKGKLGEKSPKEVAAEKKQDEPSNEELQFAKEYRAALFKLLGFVTNKMNEKSSFEELRTFCAQILAVAAIRLPEFGRQVCAVTPHFPDQ